MSFYDPRRLKIPKQNIRMFNKEQQMASNKGTRILKVFKALQGNAIHGLSNKEIAEIVGTSAVNVVRDLDDLIAEGLVERTHDGRFRYGIQVIKISRAHENEFKKMRTHLDEVEQRIGRGSQL